MKLPRLQLFEFHEQSWIPAIFRHFSTDFLSFLWCFDGFGTTKPSISLAVELIQKGFKSTNAITIVDLASGSGKAVAQVGAELHALGHKEFNFILTDIHPNIEAFSKLEKEYDFISYEKVSVDATNCTIEGCKTFFASFHHFNPETALKILKNAIQNKKEGIGIFEMTDRGFWNLFLLVGIAPLWVFLFTPFIHPFRLSRIFFTYIIPIVPLMLWWDGIISLFRTYSEEEILAFVKEADPNDTFEWQIKREICGIPKVFALIGYPKTQN